MVKRALLVFGMAAIMLLAYATHQRCGSITYRHLSGATYEFVIVTCANTGSTIDRDSLDLVIHYVGNTTPIATLSAPRTLKELLPGNVSKNIYKKTYTFPGMGQYRVYTTDQMRMAGINNIGNSANMALHVETTLWVFTGNNLKPNNSPLVEELCFTRACIFTPFTFNLRAYDPDGDSLSYEFGVPMQGPGVAVVSYTHPSGMTINPATGTVFWPNVPNQGLYNVLILMREYRYGIEIGSVMQEVQIEVSDCTNEPPKIEVLQDTCVIAGAVLNKTITATDPNSSQVIILTATGAPFQLNESPAQFASVPSPSPATGTFFWQTTCNHVSSQPYAVSFKAQDNGSPVALAGYATWHIRIIAPAPQNLIATPLGNDIILNWDSPYACDTAVHFQGFSVWRREGSNPFVPDSCQTGLAGKGYVKIASKVMGFTYTDQNLERGKIYCYRIVADFARGTTNAPYDISESIPSNEACAELKRDLPVITHVSVVETDAANGKMLITWMKPNVDDLDTIINPGPYRYVLHRSSDGGSTFTPIATFTTNAFSEPVDTHYIDTLINTVQQPYHYRMDFFVMSTTLLGQTSVASSIFLTIASNDNKLHLQWNVSVPWTNVKYFIYRSSNFGGPYVLIDSTVTQQYTDTGLTNLKEYCYVVTSFGFYSGTNMPDSLFNDSQIVCAIPKDTIPPCSPVMLVQTPCDVLAETAWGTDNAQNFLVWNNPNHYCADDVVRYNVYFKPTKDASWILLISKVDPNDTSYIHINPNASVAGCYAVTAIDSFNNESAFSNIVCVDNCPIYELPNVFTPNNDGFNDRFVPFKPYRFIDHIDIKIFTRWGQLVYTTTDPEINWDGTDMKTDKELSSGVYFYVCEVYEIRLSGVEKRKEPLTGFIHLIRPK